MKNINGIHLIRDKLQFGNNSIYGWTGGQTDKQGVEFQRHPLKFHTQYLTIHWNMYILFRHKIFKFLKIWKYIHVFFKCQHSIPIPQCVDASSDTNSVIWYHSILTSLLWHQALIVITLTCKENIIRRYYHVNSTSILYHLMRSYI